jgi:putative SOS response-associated peptidase YedK
MCGRFVSASAPDDIAKYFDAAAPSEELPASYNVAPTTDIYAVVTHADGTRHLEVFRWGLVPAWAKDIKVGQRMINARSETLASKGAFKPAFSKGRRCLIPMDGFYEWQAVPGRVTAKGKPAKQPMYIQRLDGEPLAVAGLWEAWRDKASGADEPWLHSATILTTSANETMEPVHDRMPVILPASAWDAWLDPANNDVDALSKLLVPAPANLLTLHPVSTEVNKVANRGAELIEPVDPDADPPGLPANPD